MTDIDLILMTTGVVLVKSSHFDALSADKIKNTSIFSHSVFKNVDADIDDYTKNKLIFFCREANIVYKEFNTTKSFENYLRMINLFKDLVCSIPLKQFMEFQAVNRNLSNTLFNFYLEMYKENLNKIYQTYLSLPGTARLVPNNYISNEDSDKRLQSVRRACDKTWVDILPGIINEQTCFVTLFKHTLVDIY